ncbi:MAG: hypothetical protein ACRDG4_19760 [Chloroflexota bacterium]
MGARLGRPAPIGNAMPAVLATRIGSLVAAAADPHTLAITVWNGTPGTVSGRIEVDLSLEDEAGGYELIDAAGDPVPYRWLGDRGAPPIRLNPARHEIPDFDGIMAHIHDDRVLGMGIRTVSMRVLRDTLHVEIAAGDRTVLCRADLEEVVRDAFSLADDANCRCVAVTLHRAVTLRVTAWVSAVPAYGYRTLLVRPRPRPSVGVRLPIATPMPELFSAGENEPYRDDASPAAGAVPLQTHVAPCVDGALPPSASLVTVRPHTLVLGNLKETENGDGILLRLGNEGDRAECARVSLLLPIATAELIDLDERPAEVLGEGEPRTDFTVAIPPRGTVTVRLQWAAVESISET